MHICESTCFFINEIIDTDMQCIVIWGGQVNYSPYLTGMRQVRNGFVNRFAKPSPTVAKRSHGIAKSLHASGTRRTVPQGFKHVILFCATKIIAKPSPSHRICREPVTKPSPTLCRGSQTHGKELSAICTMRQICDINKTISRLNCEK